LHSGLKFRPRTVTVPPAYTSGGLNGLVFEKIAGFMTVNAAAPVTVFSIDIATLAGLLQDTFSEHDPGKTDELIVATIIVSETTLQDIAGRVHTVAEQFCNSATKLVPNKLMVAPE
jgi:hypothetical protein